MAQYEEYKKNRETYLQEQRQKGLSIGEQIGAEADLTAKELQRRFGEREKVGTFRDRAKYFFEDVLTGPFRGPCIYRFRDFSAQASCASITAPRKPSASREATASIVVPPGEQTMSFNCPGCFPVSSTILAEP